MSVHLGRGVFHGVNDVLIAGAAAEIAFQSMTDLLFSRGRILPEQPACGHDHSGRAITTLEAMAFPEAFLQRVQLALLSKPFDGGDFSAVGLYSQNGAGFDGLAVHHRRAGAADGCLAADVSPGQSRQVANEMNQQQSRLDIGFVFPAVDGYIDLHAIPPRGSASKAMCWIDRTCAASKPSPRAEKCPSVMLKIRFDR